MYNINGNLGYKGFDFSFNFNGVSGNKIYDNTANSNFTKSRLAKSSNTTAEAIQYPGESNTNSTSVSTRYLKSGAYLRLNNVSLGYNFSPQTLGIGDWITSLRLSVTGQNLFVITDYDGYDPEVNTERNIDDVTSYGIDYLSYPKARTIVLGLNISF
jgi:iron complex outermembrane receptor protein